ncbi:hypothetical protein [Aquimarina algicola]|nr:hypothetical protein [Aquimarina algicola]
MISSKKIDFYDKNATSVSLFVNDRLKGIVFAIVILKNYYFSYKERE